MSHTKSERNAEIVRRARAGQQTADIAAEFNVSLSRVYQILKAAPPAVAGAGSVGYASGCQRPSMLPEPPSVGGLAPAPYRGEVQVLAGTAACRPLTLTPAMRQVQERARAAQPAMRSLGNLRCGPA